MVNSKIHNEIYKLLLELEMKLLQPEIRDSAEEISELLDAEFVEFCSSGHIWRYHPGDAIDSHKGVVTRYELINFKTKELSEDVFLATYECRRYDKHDKLIVSLRSSIWKNTEGKWQMLFHQGTPANS